MRSRRLSVVLALAVAAALLAVPTATADDEDDLKRWQQKVQQQVAGAKDDLHRSSKKLRRLDGKVDAARSRLHSARSRLSSVQAQLRVAQTKSARTAQQLRQAERRLDLAAAKLRQARREVQGQRETVRGTVTDLATKGDPRLEALTSMLDSGSLEELMINRTAGELVVNTQFQSLVDLEAAEAARAERKQQVKQARNEVAAKKRRADRLVARKRDLVGEASTVRNRVNSLVATTVKAKRRAKWARTADRQALRKLEAREKRVRRKILAARQSGPNFSGKAGGYLLRPVNGPITSSYGYRTHPIYGYRSMHNGVDFAAPCGTPMYAGSDGRVVHTYYDEVYGHRLYLAIGKVNGDRITLVYNHMPSASASSGQTFARGDVVGRVGTTGWSTGCHLHFMVLRNGDPVDPMQYL